MTVICCVINSVFLGVKVLKCTERISCEDIFDKTLSLITGRAYGHEDLKNLLATSDITVGGKAFTISK